MRVRSMQMNDAHIYCSEAQFEEEFMGVIGLYLKYFELFGLERYVMRLSLHDKRGLGKKYVDNERLWLKTEDMVRRAMDNGGVPYVESKDEAAFYGPKIDVQVWSAIGREFSLATNQVDFAVPPRFDLKFTNSEGEDETPLCIHRAPLSTHERMVGFLLEHYAGKFPVWLAPEQARVIPITDEHNDWRWRRRADRAAAAGRGRARQQRPGLGSHERENSQRTADAGSLHARRRRSRSRAGDGGPAPPRRQAAERPAGGGIRGAGDGL